jgi:acetylglutamate kinase
VDELERVGVQAVSIQGKDGHTLLAKKKTDGPDLGFVGEVEKVDSTLLSTLMDNGFVPVIAPVGVMNMARRTTSRRLRRIGGGRSAPCAEAGVHHRRGGILTDKDNPDTIIRQLSEIQARKFIDQGIITGGMIPKVECFWMP